MKFLDFSEPESRFRSIGLLILMLFFILSVFAAVLSPYDPYQRTGLPFERPSLEHPLGCNDVGHDLFSELLYGGRISLFIGLFASLYSTLAATVLALISGYFGGRTDRLIMRCVDVVMSLPFLPLVIVLGVFLGPGISTQIIVITTVMWASPCRELRSQVMKIRSSGYVDASKAMGGSSGRIIFRHVLPELMPLIVPQFVRVVQSAIMIESSLSFLGLGDPVLKSWGSILFFANTRAAFLTGAWINWVLPPGLCITLTVLGFSLVGFSLNGKTGLVYHSFGSYALKRGNKPLIPPDGSARLSLRELSTAYSPGKNEFLAVNGVSLDIAPGEMLGLVGESGCGKSTIAMSILGLLRHPTEIRSGCICLDSDDLLDLKGPEIVALRGKRMAYIPQNAMNALNPVITVEGQLAEAVKGPRYSGREEKSARIREVLELVDIPLDRAAAYSHELSGGMKQRIVIAMAIINNPDFLIADEPTTGLDVLVQDEIVHLLIRLKERMGISILFITHDLPLVMNHADKLTVMYQGRIVDRGTPESVYNDPTHDHTKELFRNFPRLFEEKRWNRLVPGHSSEQALTLSHVNKTFHSKRGLLSKHLPPVPAVRDVSLSVMPGEVVGLIGGSGSGKSTIARMILGLESIDSGRISIAGRNASAGSAWERQQLRRQIHLVFQDPYGSMRNHMKIADIVAEPLQIQGISDKGERERLVAEALREVNLPQDAAFVSRTPDELSGGQRQRLSFARAIAAKPRFIIADEPTSMLDVSLRCGLLELMEKLRIDYGVGFLFITHDLSLARHFCDRILVLNRGSLLEEGDSDSVIFTPRHDYTFRLIHAAKEPELMRRPVIMTV